MLFSKTVTSVSVGVTSKAVFACWCCRWCYISALQSSDWIPVCQRRSL